MVQVYPFVRNICRLAEALLSHYYRREVRAKLGPSICHSLASKRVYERDSVVARLSHIKSAIFT